MSALLAEITMSLEDQHDSGTESQTIGLALKSQQINSDKRLLDFSYKATV